MQVAEVGLRPAGAAEQLAIVQDAEAEAVLDADHKKSSRPGVAEPCSPASPG